MHSVAFVRVLAQGQIKNSMIRKTGGNYEADDTVVLFYKTSQEVLFIYLKFLALSWVFLYRCTKNTCADVSPAWCPNDGKN